MARNSEATTRYSGPPDRQKHESQLPAEHKRSSAARLEDELRDGERGDQQGGTHGRLRCGAVAMPHIKRPGW